MMVPPTSSTTSLIGGAASAAAAPIAGRLAAAANRWKDCRRDNLIAVLSCRAEVLLKHQRDGAAQARHSVLVAGSNRGDAAARQGLVLHFRLDHRSEARPRPRQVADDDNTLRGKSRDDHAHA